MNNASPCHLTTSEAETHRVPYKLSEKKHAPHLLSSHFAAVWTLLALNKSWEAVVWCWQLDTNILPVWIQKGILPSVCARCGPLKLYLYSKRRWGASSDDEAPAATSATPRWNNNVVRKVINNITALGTGRRVADTAMFRNHCWRSVEATSMTGCL